MISRLFCFGALVAMAISGATAVTLASPTPSPTIPPPPPAVVQMISADHVASYDFYPHSVTAITAPTPAAPFLQPTPNLAMAIGVPLTAQSPDPCAGRTWSFAHPLRICGRLRLVPADPVARDLFYGNLIASTIDSARSAAGQRALFARRSRIGTLAATYNLSSPTAAEGDTLMKPFASGGIWTYMLGSLLIDAGQNAVARDLPPMLGLRALDQTSLESISLQDTYAHIVNGANTWTPVFARSRAVDTAIAHCRGQRGKHACPTLWDWLR
ncbi:MAG TPA: hypothetical protein VIN40_02085 [Candidatus Tyrphobacter sp.]